MADLSFEIIPTIAPLNERLLNVIKQMLAAIEAGGIDSPEMGEPEVGIPIHKWHEEWEHHARAVVAEAEQG